MILNTSIEMNNLIMLTMHDTNDHAFLNYQNVFTILTEKITELINIEFKRIRGLMAWLLGCFV